MALLAEYALTPDIFDATSYAGDEHCVARLELIKDALLHNGLVRNLRNGDWERLLVSDQRLWHRRGRELLKKLALQNRLTRCASSLSKDPNTDVEWCEEALATRKRAPLAGVIATRRVKEDFRSEQVVASIDRLGSTSWWSECSESMRLGRNLKEYRKALDLVLRHANSIMFIDPHIDLTEDRYKDFVELLLGAGNRRPPPSIEIHRVCYVGPPKDREFPNFEALFRPVLTDPLAKVGLSVKVFIWDDFHDRYVISDLVGISAPYGFDVSSAKNNLTTWTRLCRSDRDDIQKEFHPDFHRHKTHGPFTIP